MARETRLHVWFFLGVAWPLALIPAVLCVHKYLLDLSRVPLFWLYALLAAGIIPVAGSLLVHFERALPRRPAIAAALVVSLAAFSGYAFFLSLYAMLLMKTMGLESGG